jgi:hypothetical protein
VTTVQIIKARSDEQTITFYAPTVDAAVEFASWLTDKGYATEIMDGVPAAHPRTPSETLAADALTQMYARSLIH